MQPQTFFKWQDNRLEPLCNSVVQEFPLQLIVNGREIATLIGSPHDLRFLVAGFLRLQGFISSLEEFEMFSVCEEFGIANLKIKGELPERLKPVLTSGCGAGISFSMPDVNMESALIAADKSVAAAEIFELMEALARYADNYRNHGGIHSAAIGRDGELLLYAEDLGRHNTLDRIAGEALFKSVNLAGTILVTSGRVSTEMVAKSALLGVKLIASRTSPTDMAIKLCRESGITLIGYLRGNKFTVYSHPERVKQYPENKKITGISGLILAGGSSSRMGTNKSLLKLDDTPLIELVYRKMAKLFDDVIIVTNTPDEYDFIPCRKISDIYSGEGSVAGLHAGLSASKTELCFVTACDAPLLDPALVRFICAISSDKYDAVVPFSRGGQEPLHAVYNKSCLTEMALALEAGDKKILNLLEKLKTRFVTNDEMAVVANAELSFYNVNTPEEYQKLAEKQSR